MKSNRRNITSLGVFFLSLLVFSLLSGYIIPGRDPDIGGFQLAVILFCGVAALYAFDFSLLWPRHSLLSKRDWVLSIILVFAGVAIFSVRNIFQQLDMTGGNFWPAMKPASYFSLFMIVCGLYWRFHIQLDSAAGNIVEVIKRAPIILTVKKYLASFLFVALALFLLVGGTLAYIETPSMEVVLNLFRLPVLFFSLFLAGRSIVHFFLGDEQPLALQMLAPLAGMTLWALGLGFGVGLRVPVWQIAIPLWGVTIFLAWRGFNHTELRRVIPWVVLSIGLALLATFPYVLHGFSVYMGSSLPDGWSYIAYGQYLWHYSRGFSGGLQPLYQYAAHLSVSRYVGSSMLGFLSPITGLVGDTQSASGFFFSVVLFVYSSSIIAFALYKFNTLISRTFFILFTILSGWTFTVVMANNLDQAMVLAFLPGLALLMEKPHFDRPRWIILVASILAASAYIYAEMTIFIAFVVTLLSLEQFLRQKLSLKKWLLGGIVIFLFVLIFLLPFLSEFYPFLLAQLGIANRANRPGGTLILELLSTKYNSIALWGMGADLFTGQKEMVWYNIRLWLSYFLGGGLLVGIFLQLKVRKFGSFVIAIFFIAIIYYYLHFQNYAYAAYKLISISWWFMFTLIVEGIQLILATRHRLVKYVSQIVFLSVVLGFLAVFFIRSDQFNNSLRQKSITPFRQLETLPVSDNDPIIASVWGWLPNQWAMYYLRQQPSLVYPYRSYANQAHVIPYIEKAASVDFGEVQAVLTDQENPFFPSRDVLWQNQIYTLWKMPAEWAYVAEVANPVGVVAVDQPNTLWLGHEEIDMVILASRPGDFILSFDTKGDSDLIRVPNYYVLVVMPTGEERTLDLVKDHQAVTLSLAEGKNQISIQLMDQLSASFIFPDNGQQKYPVRIENLEIIPSP